MQAERLTTDGGRGEVEKCKCMQIVFVKHVKGIDTYKMCVLVNRTYDCMYAFKITFFLT